MNHMFPLDVECSDDESSHVNHHLSNQSRKVYVLDSSDEESIPRSQNSAHETNDAGETDSFIGKSSDGESQHHDDHLAAAMNKLSLENKESAWQYDQGKNEFILSPSKIDMIGVTWPKISIPYKAFESLYPHQRIGVQWAASLHSNKIGGILADDMGLGKTWTSLSFLGGLMRANTIQSALIIAPFSILRSWEREAHKILRSSFVPHIDISVVSSETQPSNRQRILRRALSRNKELHAVVITSHGLVANDPQQFMQGDDGFDYVVIDEAHKIKNDSTKVAKGCRRVCSCDNTHRLLLTGTPIQNDLREMWVLFDVATSRKVLGSYNRFKKDFGDPIELGREKNATQSTVNAAHKANASLQALLKPYFLQRMKADILSEVLPSKKEFIVWTHLSPHQRRLYEDFVKSSDAVNTLLSSESKSPLVAIDWLRKLIGHPLLVDQSYDKQRTTLSRLGVSELLEQSAKLKVLLGLIQNLSSSGHRSLVFSNSTMTLDIIERVLHGMSMTRIDGKTKERDRQRFVDEFNRDDSNIEVMLLSTKAGGLGLTLTGADRVVIFNPSWNPTDDSQAVDRCYRIGQKKPVEVYRLIAAGTVEEKTYEKQIFKDGINRVVTKSTSQKTERYFDKKDLSRLFTLAPPGKCELLERLWEKNRIGNVGSSSQGNFLNEHDGVVGLSRHDAVYLEDSNVISSPPKSPFCGPTSTKVVGKARRVLERRLSRDEMKNSHMPGLPFELQSRTHNTFHDEHHHKKSLSSNPRHHRFEDTKVFITEVRSKGQNERALDILLDLLENKEQLSKYQSLWMHQQIAHVSSNLGLLPK